MIETLTSDATAGEAGPFGLLEDEGRSENAPMTDFRRLVRLVQDNERLLAELELIRMKIRQAWVYLSEPGCNVALAMTHLERLRMKRSALLTHLRANRIEARALVGHAIPDHDPIELN